MSIDAQAEASALPTAGLLELVSIDIFGWLQRTTRENQHVPNITDSFPKLKRAMPIAKKIR